MLASEDLAPAPGPVEAASSVRVVARFRPPVTPGEEADERAFAMLPDGRSVASLDRRFLFELDQAFGETASDDDVYDCVGAPGVRDVLAGYNTAILAYGHTGSGKTHCLFGHSEPGTQLGGIAARAARQVFDRIEAEAREGADFVLHCSFVEIYRERLRDLLNPSNQSLRIRDVPMHGLGVDGLTQEPAISASEVLRALSVGRRNRATAATQANEHSSRSHAIFSLHVHRRAQHGSAPFTGKMALVDLAGSERVSRSKAVGETLEEAKKINVSLTALGKVIDALVDQRQHVPYRDSILTRVLEEPLGGNCRTTLLVAASACAQHMEMTLSSMRFATRTRQVHTRATVNYLYSSEDLLPLVGRLQRELAVARRQLNRQSLESRWPLMHSTWSSGYPLDDVLEEAGSPCCSSASTASAPAPPPGASRRKGLSEECRPEAAEASEDGRAAVAAAAVRGLEEALLSGEEALEEAREIAAEMEAGGSGGCGDAAEVLRERWRALRAGVDAWCLSWRLERERERAQALAHEVTLRTRRVEELQRRLEDGPPLGGTAKPRQPPQDPHGDVRTIGVRQAVADGLTSPWFAASPSTRTSLDRRQRAARQRPPFQPRLQQKRDEADGAVVGRRAGPASEAARLRAELDARARHVAALATELAAQGVSVEALRHELCVKDVVLGHVQRQSLEKAIAREEQLLQLVHGVERTFSMLEQREAQGVAFAKMAPAYTPPYAPRGKRSFNSVVWRPGDDDAFAARAPL